MQTVLLPAVVSPAASSERVAGYPAVASGPFAVASADVDVQIAAVVVGY